MPTKPKILVTSAAGRVGRQTVTNLREKGYPVRAFLRQDDHRADALLALGAEVFLGNLFDFNDLKDAMTGVQRAFHCPPFAPNLLHNSMLVCLAAQEARLQALVLLSGWNPSPEHPSLVSREHWMANNLARWMPDVGVIHLNPGIFAFPYLLTLPVTRQLGILPLPFGEGLNAPVAERDIARCAVALLADPGQYIGTDWRPTGPELLTGRDVATILGEVLGRKIRYNPISHRLFAKAARAMGFADFDTYHLRHYAEEIAQGAFALAAPTDHVERLTGSPAESFADTARWYAEDVRRLAPSIAGLSDTSKLGALAFMIRMMLTPAPSYRAEEAAEGFARLQSPMLAHENAQWRASAEAGGLHLLPQNPPLALPRSLGDLRQEA
ncbi:MAG: NmrA family NAD(P)-binding protein [Mangrovicoccus sp.]